MGIRSVAIYSEEDRLALFRTKADESYEIGKGKSPLDAYLDIDEIISLAKRRASSSLQIGFSIPGIVATPASFATIFEVILSPSFSITSGLGPMKVIPSSLHFLANSGFSDKNP